MLHFHLYVMVLKRAKQNVHCFCQSHDVAGASNKLELDLMLRKRVMAEKEAQYRRMVQCKADGTCPELVMKQSGGPAECVDGKCLILGLLCH